MMRSMSGAASPRPFAPASTRVITYCRESRRSVRWRSETSRSSAARLASIIACRLAVLSMSPWLLRMASPKKKFSSATIETWCTQAHGATVTKP